MEDPARALDYVQQSVSKWFRAKHEEVDLEAIEQEIELDEVSAWGKRGYTMAYGTVETCTRVCSCVRAERQCDECG